MIAIYARQSVDRADSISIESQIEFCQYETRGEAFQSYLDRGFSGKNTDRPAFVQMMDDIDSGLINKVIVYKLDRISRSVLDFSAMMEHFAQQHVEFVSCSEKFDTSSPMGRAMLNICIVFAQLERETIQKRVTDAYFSRSQKSFYMGGRVPYGFNLIPTELNGVKTSMYEINPAEAEQIRLIYELYSQPECSYGDIIRYFQQHGVTKNGRPWERTRLADVLRNPIYVRADLAVYEFYRGQGAILANDAADFIGVNGCYYYKGQGSQGRKQINLEGNHLVLAPHEGIVPAQLWLKCRAKCLEAQQVRPYQKAKNTWLAGKIKCGLCGYALVDKHYPTRKSRYLLCSNKLNSHACAGSGTIYSDEIEEIVYGEMRKKLAQFTSLRKRKQRIANPELTTLQVELAQVEAEIASLMERLAQADDALFRYIDQRVRGLDAKKQELSRRALELKLRKEADYTEINNHLTVWDELSFEDKRRTVDQLVKVIHATSDTIKIAWRI
ncbi:MAG: recombinase family protein [Bacillota bacterium]|nr:recombinase family protein [Bacillota bacterium]